MISKQLRHSQVIKLEKFLMKKRSLKSWTGYQELEGNIWSADFERSIYSSKFISL